MGQGEHRSVQQEPDLRSEAEVRGIRQRRTSRRLAISRTRTAQIEGYQTITPALWVRPGPFILGGRFEATCRAALKSWTRTSSLYSNRLWLKFAARGGCVAAQ